MRRVRNHISWTGRPRPKTTRGTSSFCFVFCLNFKNFPLKPAKEPTSSTVPGRYTVTPILPSWYTTTVGIVTVSIFHDPHVSTTCLFFWLDKLLTNTTCIFIYVQFIPLCDSCGPKSANICSCFFLFRTFGVLRLCLHHYTCIKNFYICI